MNLNGAVVESSQLPVDVTMSMKAFERQEAFASSHDYDKRGERLTEHGERFLAVASSRPLRWLNEKLTTEHATKCTVLGPGGGRQR